ncbi:MAG: glycosyltransferase family 39 protein, partial [Anaerolineae bacterium]|nr:glycosyltransferase family 39 protein [Anaerolineae bacterium]
MTGLTILHAAERSKAVVVIILLLVAALGARGLNADTYWYDEWWSIYNAGGMYSDPFSPLETFTRVQQQDPYHPPGYFFLLGVWGGMVGWSEAAARSLSLFGGVLAVAMIYRLGCDLDSRKTGFYAALALGFSAFFVSYLHELRGYSLLPFLGGLGLWMYWRIRQTLPSPGRLAALFLALVAMLYTHYIAGMLALSIGLYHLIAAPKDRRWLPPLLVISAAGLAFVPWLGTVFGISDVVAADPSRHFVSQDALTAFSNLLYLFSNGSIALLAILAVYALPGGRRGARGLV